MTWTKVTPEVMDEKQRLAVHVVNHSLESAENRQRTVRFLRARVAHYVIQLPLGWTQVLMLDDRAQAVSPRDRAELQAALAPTKVTFLSESRPGWPST
ncbi:MAG TPA: hypothetical protein VM686_39205 [Polyangiaceae bacterium]|nr:hypothetical protein [Polyangiaceae bacterium]